MNPVWITWHGRSTRKQRSSSTIRCSPLRSSNGSLPWGDQWSDNGATAANPVSHFLGGLSTVLGRYEDADRYFAQSAALCQAVGAKFFLAQTELLRARMLLRRGNEGDERRARGLLRHAHDVSAAAGYASVLRRAADAGPLRSTTRDVVPGGRSTATPCRRPSSL